MVRLSIPSDQSFSVCKVIYLIHPETFRENLPFMSQHEFNYKYNVLLTTLILKKYSSTIGNADPA